VEVGAIPQGVRRIVPILGGEMSGPRLNGKVLPGGMDYQVWRSDGVTEIHARYIIETVSGAHVYVEASGLRRGPPHVMERLFRGEPVDQVRSIFAPCPDLKPPTRTWGG